MEDDGKEQELKTPGDTPEATRRFIDKKGRTWYKFDPQKELEQKVRTEEKKRKKDGPGADGGGSTQQRPPSSEHLEGTNCRVLKEFQDECESCTPRDLSSFRLPRDSQKKLDVLSIERKLTCERLALLKCKLDELRYQRRVWEAETQNTYGDYFSKPDRNKLRKLSKCNPNSMYDYNELGQLKALLASWTQSQRVCKGFHHVKTRVLKTGQLHPEYTLANMSWDQVKLENQWSNDKYTKEALKNRLPEKPTGDRVVCDKPGTDQIVPPKIPEIKTDKPLDKPIQKKDGLTEPPVVIQHPERESSEEKRDIPVADAPPHHEVSTGPPMTREQYLQKHPERKEPFFLKKIAPLRPEQS